MLGRPWILAVLLSLAASSGAPALAESREEKLLASADAVAKKVSKLRGLRIKRRIRRGVMNKSQLKKRLLKRVGQEFSPGELPAEALLLKRFGLLDENADYLAVVIDLLTDQIAGFYDPWEKQLYIASFQTAGGEELMAHEIDHALQDQHFDLRKFMGKGKNNSDSKTARQALVEGDGMAVMVEFMMAGIKQAPPWGNDQVTKSIAAQMGAATGIGSFAKAPLFLREGLIFPYMAGLEFVAHVRKKSPWSSVDRIYRKPPLSSEHILHPKSYERYERPDEIKVKSLTSLPQASVIHHDVQGELGTRIWLRTHGVSAARAELAAAGWGGDRAAVYGTNGQTQVRDSVGISSSIWDSEVDAIEFFEAARDALGTQLGAKGPASGSTLVTFAGKRGRGAIERRGDHVVLAIGSATVDLKAVIADVFKTWAVRRR